jgi:O-antigen ligase
MVAAAICGFVALLVALFSGEITDAIPRDLWTLNGRTLLWTKSARHVVESPFLGVGYYTSRYLLMDSQFYAGHAHNSYVDTLLTTGLVGLSLLLVFLAYCLKVSLIAKNAFLTSMLVICGLGSIFNPLILVTNLYTFYLFLIVLVVAENAARRRPASANVSLTISQSAAIQR